jgi:hypothetical protein
MILSSPQGSFSRHKGNPCVPTERKRRHRGIRESGLRTKPSSHTITIRPRARQIFEAVLLKHPFSGIQHLVSKWTHPFISLTRIFRLSRQSQFRQSARRLAGPPIRASHHHVPRQLHPPQVAPAPLAQCVPVLPEFLQSPAILVRHSPHILLAPRDPARFPLPHDHPKARTPHIRSVAARQQLRRHNRALAVPPAHTFTRLEKIFRPRK